MKWNKTYGYIIGLVVVAGLAFVGFNWYTNQTFHGYTTGVLAYDDGNQSLDVIYADSPEKRIKGLSDSRGLPDNTGMLFVFPVSDLHGFWMKDMRYSIDIVWISVDGNVVTIIEDVAPETHPAVFMPDDRARYVLELEAGDASRLGITETTRFIVDSIPESKDLQEASPPVEELPSEL